MNRTLVSGLVAFALITGAGLAMSDTAEAGCFGARRCGGVSNHGMFRTGCGGGLFSKLRAKRNCCAPEPVCCTPEPVCCEPAPCCEPASCCGRSRGCGLLGRHRGHGCKSSSRCGSSGCGSSGCGGSVIVEGAAVEAATESSSDAAPPAPAPDAATDA
jgi:hypothetical protein